MVKDRYERDFSIIVGQTLNKKSAGQIFNELKSLGLKNLKVHSDDVQLISYVVQVDAAQPSNTLSNAPHSTVDVKEGQQTKPSDPFRTPAAIISVEPDKQAESPPETVIQMNDTEQIAVAEDEKPDQEIMIVVMSDPSDITDEINFAEDEEAPHKDFEWALDKLVAEAELLTRSASPVDHVEYLHASGHLQWQLSRQWELRLAARADANYQHGESFAQTDELSLDYGDSYLRYRNANMRFTVGTDTVRWGKADIFAPTDNLATLDLTRGVLYEWGDEYRSSAVLRGEFFLQKSKLDIVYLPYFRAAELPLENNVWFPINKNNGTILGFDQNPRFKPLVQNGTIDDDLDETDGGFGLRLSSAFNSLDYDLSVQKVKRSAPYYQLNPLIRDDPASAFNQPVTFIERHPRSWVLGGDVAFPFASLTMRLEGAWFSDLPATTESFEYVTYNGWKWAGGVEFYPGDQDTRVNLQLSGININAQEKILDRNHILTLSGEVETFFANNRWKAGGRFNFGLDDKDIYLAPEISYLGWEPFEVYSAIHYLDGNQNTVGGFYQLNSMVTFGVRGQF